MTIPDEYAEAIAADIGSDHPADIGRAAGELWHELGNPVQTIEEDPYDEVPAK